MKHPKGPQLKIKVTEEQIAAAMKRDSRHCMIAEAIKVAHPDARSVSVDLATIRFTDPGKQIRCTYLTPRIAQVCLVNFDQGRAPEPFSFVLRGAHITRSGNTRTPKKMTEKELAQRRVAAKTLHEKLAKTKLVRKREGHVPDRFGGRAAPVQMSDGVPFSRRRAFGLRGLEY